MIAILAMLVVWFVLAPVAFHMLSDLFGGNNASVSKPKPKNTDDLEYMEMLRREYGHAE